MVRATVCPTTTLMHRRSTVSSAKVLPYTAVLFAIGVLMGIGSGMRYLSSGHNGVMFVSQRSVKTSAQ